MSDMNKEITSHSSTQSTERRTQVISPCFQPGDKVGKDGTIFRKDPAREAFDQRWREAVARGEDPTKNLQRQVESTGTSSFVEYWWRKARGKGNTRAEEKETAERREKEEVESGTAGLLGPEWREREQVGGEVAGLHGSEERGGDRSSKSRLHDKLRWGI